tara:strand:+ start:4787 stop:4951 length:165 start_codon:yes stop_codon:yes gene_type:complete
MEEKSEQGKLYIETPDGQKQFIGYAYGLAKKGLWVWNGRVWMARGYMAELKRCE